MWINDIENRTYQALSNLCFLLLGTPRRVELVHLTNLLCERHLRKEMVNLLLDRILRLARNEGEKGYYRDEAFHILTYFLRQLGSILMSIRVNFYCYNFTMMVCTEEAERFTFA